MGHIHEKIDFTVSIYIVFENKVLLHMHKKLHRWFPPGGHIELDEDPNEAALREAKEETGLEVELAGEERRYDTPFAPRDLIMPRFLNRHYFDEAHAHEHVDMAFFAHTKSADARHEIKGMAIRWFAAEELSDPQYAIGSDVQTHAHAALRELSVVRQ